MGNEEFDEEKIKHATDLLLKIHEDTEDGYIIFAIVRADNAGLLDALIEFVEQSKPDDSQLDDWLNEHLPPMEDEEDDEEEE